MVFTTFLSVDNKSFYPSQVSWEVPGANSPPFVAFLQPEIPSTRNSHSGSTPILRASVVHHAAPPAKIVALSGAMWLARHPRAHRPAPRFSGWASGVPMTSVFDLDIGQLETRQVAQVSLVQVSNAVEPVLCSSLRARAGSCPFWKRLVHGIVPQGRFYVQVGLVHARGPRNARHNRTDNRTHNRTETIE